MLRKILLISTAALVAGCASSAKNQALREAPSFQAGYSDGCLTASESDKSFSTKTARNAYSFDNDEAYRAGWRQGYFECQSKTPGRNDGGRVLGERNQYE